MWDDEAGYNRDDTKHPDFAELAFDRADMERKRQKEDAFVCADPEGDWIADLKDGTEG